METPKEGTKNRFAFSWTFRHCDSLFALEGVLPYGLHLNDIGKKVGHDAVGHRLCCGGDSCNEQKDGRFSLEERADDGYWDFPGGSIEFNETAEDAAKRELFAETKLSFRRNRLRVISGVYSGPLTYYRYREWRRGLGGGCGVSLARVTKENALAPQEPKRCVRLAVVSALDAIPAKMSPAESKRFTRDLQGEDVPFSLTPKGKQSVPLNDAKIYHALKTRFLFAR
jgi:8-oxo-dGTP pyrophosphatase MutT (NUDIX family)